MNYFRFATLFTLRFSLNKLRTQNYGPWTVDYGLTLASR